MPAFFLNTDEYIHGLVMANYTSGAPVHGNLTLKAIVRPIRPIDPSKFRRKYRPKPRFGQPNTYYDPNRPYDANQPNDDNYDVNNQYDSNNQYDPNNPYDINNQYDRTGSYNRPIVEKYFTFDEKLPFWFTIPQNYYEPVPYMRFVSTCQQGMYINF